MKPIKHISFLFLLLLTACTDTDHNNPAGELLVTVSGTCTAEIKLYDYGDNKQLDKQYYDCQHTKYIQFKPPQTGLYLLIATSGDKTVKTTCSFVQGYIKEHTIQF